MGFRCAQIILLYIHIMYCLVSSCDLLISGGRTLIWLTWRWSVTSRVHLWRSLGIVWISLSLRTNWARWGESTKWTAMADVLDNYYAVHACTQYCCSHSKAQCTQIQRIWAIDLSHFSSLMKNWIAEYWSKPCTSSRVHSRVYIVGSLWQLVLTIWRKTNFSMLGGKSVRSLSPIYKALRHSPR